MREQNIEKLFKESFSDFSANVNPNAWENIAKELQAPVSSAPKAGSKSMGFWGYAGLVAVVTSAVIVGLIYLPKKESVSENTITQTPPAVVELKKQDAVVSSAPAVVSEVKHDAITPAEKPKVEAKHVKKNPVQPNPDEESLVVIAKKETPVNNQSVDNGVTVSPPSVTGAEKQTENILPPAKEQVAENPVVTEAPEKDFDFYMDKVESSVREPQTPSDFTFYIPNIFTPNGDRQNDDFKPMGLNYKEYHLKIFDLKGNEIFRSDDVESRWDGKLRSGDLAPAGLYTYLINVKDFNNNEHPLSGQVQLKR